MSDRKLWCADSILTLAIQIASDETGKSEKEIFRAIVDSAVYDALYDGETDLWGMGPAYLLDYCRDSGLKI